MRIQLRGLIPAWLAAVLAVLSNTASADLLLAGGSLPICSSKNLDACTGRPEWPQNSLGALTYEITPERIRQWNQTIGHELDDALRIQITGALLLLIEQQPAPMSRREFSRVLRDLEGEIHPPDQPEIKIDGEAIYQQLDDRHWWALLDHLEKIPLIEGMPRLREQVAFTHSKNEHAATIFKRFVAMAAEHRSQRDPESGADHKPTIAISAAASRDPYEALDFYRGVFEQAGAEVVWLPLDAAVQHAQSHDQCDQLTDWQQRVLSSFERPRIEPERYAEQQAFCRDAEAGPALIDRIDGLFLNGGDQWLTFQAFRKANGEPTGTLKRLLERLNLNEIVLGGTSAGTAVQSGGPMITNGWNISALLDGGQNSPPPRAGCKPTKDPNQAGQGPYCAADLKPGSLTWRAEGGLSSLPSITLDTHFSERLRQFRLIQMLAQLGGGMGLGVDETTAVEVQFEAERPIRLHVHGAHGAWLFDLPAERIESTQPLRVSGFRTVHLQARDQFQFYSSDTPVWPLANQKPKFLDCVLANNAESFTYALVQSEKQQPNAPCIALELNNTREARLLLSPLASDDVGQRYHGFIEVDPENDKSTQ